MTDNSQVIKADGGKLRPTLLFDGCPRALEAVVAVLSYGAQKYEAHSWKDVDMQRYEEAKYRHMLARAKGELNDEESGLLHLAHEACNIMFLLETELANLSEEDYKQVLKFNPPPQDHKK